ncbi:hypothetical protein O6H91_18G024100 [Diphasiastrum complanatum]|uniref:Uncharacterized protein n=1 Tax=Diphasiastrum complanatum TaxID=34168 RepID=A0ACC2AYW5_DIPCM|nr:hypothetical protein O6H91_18G024100 [Diphasiastrum complanatum]
MFIDNLESVMKSYAHSSYIKTITSGIPKTIWRGRGALNSLYSYCLEESIVFCCLNRPSFISCPQVVYFCNLVFVSCVCLSSIFMASYNLDPSLCKLFITIYELCLCIVKTILNYYHNSENKFAKIISIELHQCLVG